MTHSQGATVALLLIVALFIFCASASAQPVRLDLSSLAGQTVTAEDIFDVRDAEFVDGRLYVLNEKTSTVHVFDRSYQEVCTVGRSGSGPGEYGEVFSIAVTGDTVMVFDPMQRKAGIFQSCEHVADWNLQAQEVPYLVFDAAFHPRGLLLGAVSSEIHQRLRDGGSPGMVAVVDPDSRNVREFLGQYPAFVANGFRENTLVGTMATAVGVSISPEHDVYVYTTTSPRVQRMDPSGRVVERFDIRPPFYAPPEDVPGDVLQSEGGIERWQAWRRDFTALDKIVVLERVILAEFSRIDLTGDDSERFLVVVDRTSKKIEKAFSYDESYQLHLATSPDVILFSQDTNDGTQFLEVRLSVFTQ